jgi:hypothetical protein
MEKWRRRRRRHEEGVTDHVTSQDKTRKTWGGSVTRKRAITTA